MSFENQDRRGTLIDRRALLAAAVTGGIGLASARVEGRAQSATPEATPATPQATPATPIASPIAEQATPVITLPDASPVPDFPLTVIREQRPVESSEPVSGGTLRLFVQSADLADFSPASFRQDFQIACSLYDPLVWLDEVTCEPKPCLAESWTWSAGGRKLTFNFRDDVEWHDGSPFTADDVAFSFTVYQQDYASAVAGFFGLVTAIERVDSNTVAVSFSEPDGSFVFNAGNLPMFQSKQYGFVWSSRALGERSLNGYDWTANPPIGTGPWRFESASGTQVTLQRNETYWREATHFDTLQLSAEDDITARIDAWKQDEVDLVWPIPPLATTDLVQEPGRLYAADSLRTMFAAYNFRNPLRFNPNMLASIELRQALLLAMNRQGYQQSIFGSFIDTEKASSINQPWARDERIVNPQRNVDIAKQLLDSIGWVDNDGDGIRETVDGDVLALLAIVEDNAPQELIQILQLLDRDFRDIGVSLTVEVLDQTTWTDRWVNTHEFDLIGYSLLQYGAFNEFDLYGSAWDIRVNGNGWNPGGYANEAVDAALQEWFEAYEIDDMTRALYKLQRAVTDDPFGLFFGFPQDPVLVRPGILGYQPNKMWQSWNTRSMWKSTES